MKDVLFTLTSYSKGGKNKNQDFYSIFQDSYWDFPILFQDQPNSEGPDPLALCTAAGEGELANGAKSSFFSFCSKHTVHIIWPTESRWPNLLKESAGIEQAGVPQS